MDLHALSAFSYSLSLEVVKVANMTRGLPRGRNAHGPAFWNRDAYFCEQFPSFYNLGYDVTWRASLEPYLLTRVFTQHAEWGV
jgi:hypothetical protein